MAGAQVRHGIFRNPEGCTADLPAGFPAARFAAPDRVIDEPDREEHQIHDEKGAPAFRKALVQGHRQRHTLRPDKWPDDEHDEPGLSHPGLVLRADAGNGVRLVDR